MKLRQYQKDAINGLRLSLTNQKTKPVLQAATGAGKCLGPETPVIKFDGSIVPVSEIRVGQMLLGDDGEPRMVTGVTGGYSPMYKIIPTRGKSWRCNDKHILSLVATAKIGNVAEKNEVIDVGIDKYLNLKPHHHHCLKQFAAPFDWQRRNLSNDEAYFAGLWIGDGTTRATEISNIDEEVVDFIHDYAESNSVAVRQKETRGGMCPVWSVTNGRSTHNPVFELVDRFRGDDTKKQIPDEFITVCADQRRYLLAGIFDSDGYFCKGTFEVVQKSKRLTASIATISRSLGFRVLESVKVIDGKNYYRLSITGDFREIPTRIKRKQVTEYKANRNPLRTGFKIEPDGMGEYVGLMVDGNHRFLLADFTVVHNTVMAAEIIRNAESKGNRTLFVCDSLELVDQAVKTFDSVGLDVGVMQANHYRTDEACMSQVATAQTLERRIARFRNEFEQYPVALIMIDEAHLQYKVRDTLAMLYPKAPIIGLTATPFAKGMGNFYNDIVSAISMQELIDSGYLAPMTAYAPYVPNMKGVKQTAGDWNKDAAAAIYDGKLVADIVSTWKRLGKGRPTICFACNVVHSKFIAEEFVAAGVNAVHVDGYGGSDEAKGNRRAIIDDYKAGNIEVLCNVGIATKGFDSPHTSCLILARPTKSLSLHWQMVGRGLRTCEGKTDCVILDHAGNFVRHGFPTDKVDFYLDDGSQKSKTDSRKDGESLPIPCPACKKLKEGFKCEHCGHMPEKKNEVVNVDGELVLLSDTIKKPKYSTDDKNRWAAELRLYAYEKKKTEKWVLATYRSKFNEWPSRAMVNVPNVSDEVGGYIKSRIIAYAAQQKKNKVA